MNLRRWLTTESLVVGQNGLLIDYDLKLNEISQKGRLNLKNE